jgi:hypothetical protein
MRQTRVRWSMTWWARLGMWVVNGVVGEVALGSVGGWVNDMVCSPWRGDLVMAGW